MHIIYCFFIAECRTDQECPFDRACIGEKCLSPCLQGSIECGKGAECHVYRHRATCECPRGTQGDPRISCISGQCQYNEDCADHESCDRLNRVCRPVCDRNSCGIGAYCEGINHAIKCTCNSGLFGNPYTECLEQKSPQRPTKPECTSDAQCSSRKACIDEVILHLFKINVFYVNFSIFIEMR